MDLKSFWENLTSNQKILIVGAVFAAIVIFLILNSSAASSTDIPLTTKVSNQLDEQPQEQNQIFIEIVGQVKNPGVYEVDSNLLVIEAIELAGGYSTNADIGYVHKNVSLAVKVVAEQKIYIPAESEVGSNSSPNISSKISLNSASLEELMTLDGIGEATAKKIIAARPYASIDELLDVSGIGEVTYNNIVSNLTL